MTNETVQIVNYAHAKPKAGRKPLPPGLRKEQLNISIDPGDRMKVYAIGGAAKMRELIRAEFMRMVEAGLIKVGPQ